ncbi:hypothetical protein OVY48_08415 [Sphingobium sp. SA2]|nr:hypothetical protein [Sphingobium sp. SA2]MDT7533444.1 hypothetical protein [Sphingobium sp. SA2]
MISLKRQLCRSAALALTLSSMAMSATLQAQTQGQSRQMRVTMAAQPMASALEQLARQSGQDILFTRDAVA